jgi:pimeloyl-ACP methyl ester carboxylesterase
VRDLEAVADALRLERFGIWAMSAGGPAAIAFTARHPERVARLALASAMVSSAHIAPERRAQFERVLALVDTDWDTPGIPEMFSAVLTHGRHSDVWNHVGAAFMRRSGDGPAIAGFMRAQMTIDATADARSIRVPTLVIHARDDEVVELEAGRELASQIPGARFEIVDGAHLEGTGNAPQSIARILAFFAEGSSPGRSDWPPPDSPM